ncbi:MAG TPA: hypothetical protein VE443_02555, partial [Beijerinckiaceae bacterium]|nr:hypothetical protein [Beijerinckiaceae bacterium]
MSSSLTPFNRPSGRESKREAPAATTPLALAQRPRRNRKADWSRRLVREHELSVNDLIWPLFLIEGTARQTRFLAFSASEPRGSRKEGSVLGKIASAGMRSFAARSASRTAS